MKRCCLLFSPDFFALWNSPFKIVQCYFTAGSPAPEKKCFFHPLGCSPTLNIDASKYRSHVALSLATNLNPISIQFHRSRGRHWPSHHQRPRPSFSTRRSNGFEPTPFAGRGQWISLLENLNIMRVCVCMCIYIYTHISYIIYIYIYM